VKKLYLFVLIALTCSAVSAQELFINTEPASNMATHSLGLRWNSSAFTHEGILRSQINPELMYGASTRWMIHASAFANNWYSSEYKLRGYNAYAKYRFFSRDGLQKHFRMAAFGRVSVMTVPCPFSEVNIEGDYSGFAAGIVATQLLHKLAISSSLAYNRILPGSEDLLKQGEDLEYTLSFGYLLLPFKYHTYKQTNVNVYMEFLGKTQRSNMSDADNGMTTGGYLDAAPGIQFIIYSRARIDLSWRKQLYGDMPRLSTQSVFVRLEYNIFNL
jgi:hypothetical protein